MLYNNLAILFSSNQLIFFNSKLHLNNSETITVVTVIMAIKSAVSAAIAVTKAAALDFQDDQFFRR